MQWKTGSLGWMIVAVVLLTVFGTAFHFWWELRRVNQLHADVTAVGGQMEARYRGPAWLERLAKDHKALTVCIRWLTTEVTFVGLYGNEIDDAWLTRLGAYRQIEFLNLTNTRISDSSLKELQVLPKLKSLSLEGTEISDSGVEQLSEYPALSYVNLVRTRVTSKAVVRLQEKRPELKVLRY